MKAKDLIEILKTNPEAEIKVGFEEYVKYSELTSGTEDRVDPAEAVFRDGNSFIISPECYLSFDRVWPEELGK